MIRGGGLLCQEYLVNDNWDLRESRDPRFDMEQEFGDGVHDTGLNFADVGVYENGGRIEEQILLKKKDVSGKALFVLGEKFLISLPTIVLTE